MILSIKERLVLSMIMEPQAGRYDALKLVRRFREDLSFSEAEIKEVDLQSADGQGFKWSKEVSKDIPINEVVQNIIKKQFEKLDREERLQEGHLDIFTKFVAKEEPAISKDAGNPLPSN